MSKMKNRQPNNPDLYDELVDFQDNLHKQNLKRIHIGLLCILIIPMIFLSLMFITDSNKVIWLILWIVSLFAISAYLIVVEYGDYNLQHRVNSITGNDAEPVPLLESGLNSVNDKLESVKAEARDIIASAKASVAIDDDDDDGVEDSEFVPEIDTDVVKESLREETASNDNGSDKAKKDKKKKKSSKKDKNKKKNKKKKDKDKKDKKSRNKKKKEKKKVKEDVFDE